MEGNFPKNLSKFRPLVSFQITEYWTIKIEERERVSITFVNNE